jgi:DNA polymerase-3 subunit delta
MIQDIDKIIKARKFPPVLLMFGEEDFLLEEAYNKLTDALIDSDEARFNFDYLNGEDTDLKTILDICGSFPFIGERRVVVVKGFEKLFRSRKSKKMEKEVEPFLNYIKNPQNSTSLILVAEIEKLDGVSAQLNNPKKKAAAEKKIKAAKYPFNEILEISEWVEFPKIWEKDIADWVKNRIKTYGSDIAADALELLVAQSNPSLREINNEIIKLNIYLNGRKKIKLEDVNFVVCASRSYNVFELQQAVGERSLSQSIRILQNMLSNEKQEMLIITILTKFFTSLWKLSEERTKGGNNYQIAAATGINAFFLPEYYKALDKYPITDIDNSFFALAEADEAMKTSSGPGIYIMQKMLIRIIQGN